MIEEKKGQEFGWNLDNSYARLPEVFYSRLNPTSVVSPQVVLLNTPLATSLGLATEMLNSEDGAAIFAGNQLPEGALPLAQAYAGHQFGHFTMLGDGRALLLGEQLTPQGERYDIQLKGSGRTTYSRQGDGRAALGPMLREYIISESMYALGIPTTRSLAVVTTGEPVFRETTQAGAILTRIAASHLRVGTFQYAANWCTVDELRALADYALRRHFPDGGRENPYLYLLQEVIRKQALLISQWQLVGFVHGVMNTDNMTISGETIDYGPCAFMDSYDPDTVFSSIDLRGRYAFGNQPSIALWNLARLAEALLPLLHESEAKAIKMAEDALEEFPRTFQHSWLAGMRRKLGLFNEEEEDQSLIVELLELMKKHGEDYTNTFRELTFRKQEEIPLFSGPEYAQWQQRWLARQERQQENRDQIQDLMRSSNPALIPRNHLVESALAAALKEDYSVMERLLRVLSVPYAHSPEQEEYASLPEIACSYRTYCGT